MMAYLKKSVKQKKSLEKECETEKVVSHRLTIMMKHARMMFCCAIVPLIFRCFIDFGYLHGC